MEEKTKTNNKVKKEEIKKEDPNEIPVVRTFKADIKDYIKDTDTSYVDIVTKAANRKSISSGIYIEEGSNNYKTALIIGGIVIIVTAIFVSSYFMFTSPTENTGENPIVRAPKSIIQTDTETTIAFSENEDNLLNKIENAISTKQPGENIIYFPIKKIGINKEESFLDGSQFLKEIGINTPKTILNNLVSPFNFMVINVQNHQNEILFISKIINYERIFASLLAWEKEMPRDLQPILPQNKDNESDQKVFEDTIIKNHDSRIIKNLENQTILVYTMFNKKLLVIASSEKALELILEKLIFSPPVI